jgi:hypothetical protein
VFFSIFLSCVCFPRISCSKAISCSIVSERTRLYRVFDQR